MSRFSSLISIEHTKLWKRLSSKIMAVIMIAIMVTACCAVKYYESTQKKSQKAQVSTSWKSELQSELKAKKASLNEYKKSNSKIEKVMIGSTEKNIAEDEYYIDHNINPAKNESIWSNISGLFKDVSTGTFIALFMIIACSALIAGEFSDNTMKTMISRPYSRQQILSSKLIVSILYGIELLAVTFLATFIMEGILYKFAGFSSKDLLWTGSKILYVSAAAKTFIILGLSFLEIVVYVTLAFMLSTLFRSRSIATGFSLFLLLVGGSISGALAMYFDWGKYILFINTSFSSYITTGVTYVGTSLPFSLIVSAVYSVIFLIIGYEAFLQRDI